MTTFKTYYKVHNPDRYSYSSRWMMMRNSTLKLNFRLLLMLILFAIIALRVMFKLL